MRPSYSYDALLQTSKRANWSIEEVMHSAPKLDFSRPFLPETFARTAGLQFLSNAERLTLNHIRARGYLALFELVEQFVLPFVAGQADAPVEEDPDRAEALRNFAAEEAKHTALFQRMLADFDEGFGSPCELIGPAEDISQAILGHDPLAVAIAVLGLEYMSQGHYVESVRDDGDLDLLFKSVLRHHWIEEAQHAKLDERMVRALAGGRSPEQIDTAMDEYFDIGAFLDGGFRQQVDLDLAALERATDRRLDADERAGFIAVQHQAMRWTFLGTAMTNSNFVSALSDLGGSALSRVEEAAKAFC